VGSISGVRVVRPVLFCEISVFWYYPSPYPCTSSSSSFSQPLTASELAKSESLMNYHKTGYQPPGSNSGCGSPSTVGPGYSIIKSCVQALLSLRPYFVVVDNAHLMVSDGAEAWVGGMGGAGVGGGDPLDWLVDLNLHEQGRVVVSLPWMDWGGLGSRGEEMGSGGEYSLRDGTFIPHPWRYLLPGTVGATAQVSVGTCAMRTGKCDRFAAVQCRMINSLLPLPSPPLLFRYPDETTTPTIHHAIPSLPLKPPRRDFYNLKDVTVGG